MQSYDAAHECFPPAGVAYGGRIASPPTLPADPKVLNASGLMMLLPYLDRQRKGVGLWFARERAVANTIFTVCLVTAIVLTIIGTLFRGPNWGWVVPWEQPPAITEGH